jgi:uncharacterized membrane protein SpoIIM required for sporulation
MAAAPVGELSSTSFRRERESSWRELDDLVRQVEKRGLRALSAPEVARLPVLYRAAVSSLSVARAISLDRALLEYLEALVARAYVCVYGPRQRLRDALAQFVTTRFPAAVRAARWHLLLAAGAMLLGSAIAAALTAVDPALYALFVDDSLAAGRHPGAPVEQLREPLYSGDDLASGSLLAFVSFLFQHNAGIAVLTFACGALAGVPVLLLMLLNGFMLGAMTALYHLRGLAADWWAWILPHGITELLALAIAGAGGLLIADGMIFPAPDGRLHGLARRGRHGGLLVVGAVAMLALAAVIEGVLRQTMHSMPARYALAGVTCFAWLAYFGIAGRGQR